MGVHIILSQKDMDNSTSSLPAAFHMSPACDDCAGGPSLGRAALPEEVSVCACVCMHVCLCAWTKVYTLTPFL